MWTYEQPHLPQFSMWGGDKIAYNSVHEVCTRPLEENPVRNISFFFQNSYFKIIHTSNPHKGASFGGNPFGHKIGLCNINCGKAWPVI